jgi:hypothetical protein
VAQDTGPEFKAQNCQKKKRNVSWSHDAFQKFVRDHTPVHAPMHLSVHPPSIYISIRVFILRSFIFHSSTHLPTHPPFIHSFTHPSIHKHIYPSIHHPFILSFIHPSIHASIHPSNHQPFQPFNKQLIEHLLSAKS